MILDVDGQTLLCRIKGRLLGHGPALKHAVGLQTEIVVVSAGLVLLHDEAWLAVGFAAFGGRFGGRAKVALRFVFFEGHFSYLPAESLPLGGGNPMAAQMRLALLAEQLRQDEA